MVEEDSIKILGTESLGVRGLSCIITTKGRKIFIDPGISLGYVRHGFLPHPVQIAVGRVIKQKIIEELKTTTDVVFSHFHGDHIPLKEANPYQLSLEEVKPSLKHVKIWAKRWQEISPNMEERARVIASECGNNLINAEGKRDGVVEFSGSFPHGKNDSSLGEVMMTKIIVNDKVFVHASDIQLLSARPVDQLLTLHPDIVLASGPPLYLSRLNKEDLKFAWNNAVRLARGVGLLIIDHHLLRCDEGFTWMHRLNEETDNIVTCAAGFMGCPSQPLEAKRSMLYEKIPVKSNWHEEYVPGKTDLQGYLSKARDIFDWFIY